MIFQPWSALITNDRNCNAKCHSCFLKSRGANIFMPSRTVLTSEEYSSWVCYVQTKPPRQPYCSILFTCGSCIVIVHKLTVIAGKCRLLLLYVIKWLCQNSVLLGHTVGTMSQKTVICTYSDVCVICVLFCREMQLFVFEHMAVMENMMERLRSCVEHSYLQKEMFVHLMMAGMQQVKNYTVLSLNRCKS